jgi:hypothetical protein
MFIASVSSSHPLFLSSPLICGYVVGDVSIMRALLLLMPKSRLAMESVLAIVLKL